LDDFWTILVTFKHNSGRIDSDSVFGILVRIMFARRVTRLGEFSPDVRLIALDSIFT
jgi:hypothetical protein